MAAIEPLVEGFFDLKSPFVRGVVSAAMKEGGVRGAWQQAGTLQVDQDALGPRLVDKIVYVFSRFTSGIGTTSMVSGMIEKAADEGGSEEWVEACGEERAAILARIHRVEEARRGVVQALGLSDLQVQVQVVVDLECPCKYSVLLMPCAFFSVVSFQSCIEQVL